MMRLGLSTALALVASGAFAQDNQNAATEARTAQIKAETELEKAKAERAKAEAERIKALGLPSFEGKTTLGSGAGGIEAAMLATDALRAAATKIGGKLDQSKYIVLAGDEALDFGQAGSMRIEIDATHAAFINAGAVAQGCDDGSRGAVASGAVAAISAAAGLLRSDTEVTAVDLSSVSHRALATAVAAKLSGDAILPGAAIGTVPEGREFGPALWRDKSLLQAFNSLGCDRKAASTLPIKDPSKPTEAEKRVLAAIARYDAFFTKATTADDKGAVPIAVAARLAQMMEGQPKVLRLYVDKAGGSLTNSKNLFTMLGLDPIKVSGGLVATYLVTDPQTGKMLAGDVLACRTTIAGLRQIQEGRWRGKARIDRTVAKAECDSVIDGTASQTQ